MTIPAGRGALTVLFALTLTGACSRLSLRRQPAAEDHQAPHPVVIIDTSMGRIEVELWPDKTPATVENFLTYVDERYYDGLVFHRVIRDFMIQGGGFTPDLRHREARAPILNEARADAPNIRGTIAMARTRRVHSATSQFFINLAENDHLNHRDGTARQFGYCVFGIVTSGLEVADRIGGMPTENRNGFANAPVTPVIINKIRRRR